MFGFSEQFNADGLGYPHAKANFEAIGIQEFAFPRVDYSDMELLFSRFALGQGSKLTYSAGFQQALRQGKQKGQDFNANSFVIAAATIWSRDALTKKREGVVYEVGQYQMAVKKNNIQFSPAERVAVMKTLLTLPFQFLNDAKANDLTFDTTYDIVHNANIGKGAGEMLNMMLTDPDGVFWTMINDKNDIIDALGNYLNSLSDNVLLFWDVLICGVFEHMSVDIVRELHTTMLMATASVYEDLDIIDLIIGTNY